MKKLYENIEHINIKGGIGQLSEVVRVMDDSLQNIADYTDQLTGYLSKYSSTNKGSQYDKVVKTSLALRDELFQMSQELNDMQNQIVIYQNKMFRFEDMQEMAPMPNPYLVTKKQISVDTSVMQFNRTEMLEVATTLRNYHEHVSHHMRIITENKNSIASVWNDPQYDDFAEFIDGINQNVHEALKVFEEYVIYLENKIEELG